MSDKIKRKLSFITIIKVISISIIFGTLIYLGATKKTILVLHSYNTDYSWVRDVNEGLKRTLDNRKAGVNVIYHYMDTKNYPSPEDKEKAGTIAKEIIHIIKPDVVIAIDDDAQIYTMKDYVNDPHIKIVYAGLNAKPEIYGYDKAKNVTGVLERLPIDGIKELVTYMKPDIKKGQMIRVGHVADDSKVVKYDDKNMHEYKNWAPLDFVPTILSSTFDEWKKLVVDAKKRMDVMLVSNYRKIYTDNSKKVLVPYKDVMKWTFENSPVPIIGINAFVTEDGAGISIGTSPFEQGEVSMQVALDIILNQKKISDITAIRSQQYIVAIHEKRLKQQFSKQHTKIPTTYEAMARAINKYINTD